MEIEEMIDDDSSNYIIPSLRLDDGWFLFSSVSKFLSALTHNDMPLIYCLIELLRDAFQSKVSALQIILEALKVESGFICLVAVIFLVSLFPLCLTIAWCFSRNVELKTVHGLNSIMEASSTAESRFQYLDKQTLSKYHCQKRICVSVLHFLIVVSIIFILSIFILNEKISIAIEDTPDVFKSALTDTEYFIKSSNHQMQAEIFEHFDRAREKIKIDLEDIDKLLGERITREISVQTGLDATFESANELLESTKNLSHRVQHLMSEVLLKTLLLSAASESKIDEIQIELLALQRQCSFRDQPLCDTLKIKSLEEIGFIERLKTLNENKILQKLRTMHDGLHENTLKKLSEELSTSRRTFRNYSHQLLRESIKHGEDIYKHLTIMRHGVSEVLKRLSSVVTNLLSKIEKVWERTQPFLEDFRGAGYSSWLIGLIASSAMLVVTLFLFIPVIFTCFHVENLASVMFMMAACLLSTFSMFLGLFTILELLIGGHAEVFICRALFESPNYTVIGKLFDNPGIIYSKPPANGIFADLLVPFDHNTKHFSNQSLSVAVGDCERNKATYETFQIENLLELKHVLNYENYLDLVESIKRVHANEMPFIGFTHRIQNILDDLIQESYGNFTSYRLELTQVSPEKEINHFIDQMQRVSFQIQDHSTSARMETLATSARRIQSTVLKPLEILKNEIVFQLTALELHIEPWMKRIQEIKQSFNQSQHYLDHHSTYICANFSENFRNRLKSNLATFKSETLQKIHNNFGCRPLFDTFNGIRWLSCGHIVDSINGLFFMSLLVLCLWTILTPVSLSLASTYGKIESAQLTSSLSANCEANWSRRPETALNSPEINRSNWLPHEILVPAVRDAEEVVQMELD